MKRAALLFALLLSTSACGEGSATSNAGCDSGQINIDGTCVTLCVEDGECPSGFYCLDGKCEVGTRPAAAVIGMTPVPGSTDVGVMPLITLTFSVPMDLVSLTQSVHLLADGITEVGGNITLDDALTKMTFTLGGNLTFNTEYTMRVEAGARSTGEARVITRWERTFHTTAEADNLPPDVSIDPVTAGVISGPVLDPVLGAFEFTGGAADNETAVEQVQVQIVAAGQPIGEAWAPAEIPTPGALVIWTYSWFPRILTPAPNGVYTMYARAIDKGGNTKQVSISFLADLVPPPVPIFITEPKTPWKFINQALNIQSEINSTIEVRVNDTAIPGSPFAVGGDGVEAINVTYPAFNPSYPDVNLAVFAIDVNGNRNDTPVTRVIHRIPYSCLVASNGFPLPAATVVTGTMTDDGNGNVVLTYELSPGMADDTYLRSLYNAYGGQPNLEVDGSSSTLFRFSNDLLPDCATLGSVKLVLAVESGSWSGSIEMKPLLRVWDEAVADRDDATSTEKWQAEGATGTGDVGSSIGTLTFRDEATAPDRGVADLTLTARSWASGATENYGVLFSTTNANVSLSSTETYQAATYRPRLELQLTEPE